MATPLPIIIKPKQYAITGTPVQVTWTAADAVNGNTFACTGRETLYARNTDTVTHSVTITGTPDGYGRTQNIGPITLATSGVSGDQVVFQRFNTLGWVTGSLISLTANNASVQFYVAQEPQ